MSSQRDAVGQGPVLFYSTLPFIVSSFDGVFSLMLTSGEPSGVFLRWLFFVFVYPPRALCLT